MYLFYAFCTGILINIMVLFNGVLTAHSGVYSAAVYSYFAATIASGIYILVKKQRVLSEKRLPFYMYLAGVVSVISALCTNYAFGKISLVAITALALLAQTITSFAIDIFGFFGTDKRKVNTMSVICLLISFAGIAVMLAGAEMNAVAAVIVSLLSGITLVVNRMMNADLARTTGAVPGAFINHVVGIFPAILALMIFGKNEPSALTVLSSTPVWAYLGGVVGVSIVVATNYVCPKVSAFQATLMIFVGQIFAGAIIDALTGVEQSTRLIIGTVLVMLGVMASSVSENKTAGKTK